MVQTNKLRQNVPIGAMPDKLPSTSVGGYFIMLGNDSEQYGAGTIGIMQGKNRLVSLSYTDWQKIDSFMSLHADFFNNQLEKEQALLNAVKKR